MDKQAFKQRMRNLKSYRENNPGKGYWDWKVQTFEDGGEVGGKKEPPYPSFYNGRRVNRWTGEPLATGALKPAVDLEDFANLTPVGDVITVNEMGNAAAKKDWSGLGWASLGLLPIVGSKGSKAIKAAIKGAERTAASTISREVPKVNRSSVQKEMDRLLQQREMYKAIEGDDYFILDSSDAVNARNRVIESIDDRTIKRAKKVDKNMELIMLVLIRNCLKIIKI